MPLYENVTAGNNYAADSTWNEGSYNDRKRDYGQWMFGELAADNSDARTRALYNDLYSPQAQMEQLKAAGLSPSIFASGGIAGKSGVSGAMGQRGSSSTGGSQMLSNMFSAIAQATQIGANISKTKAETDYIKAQTSNLEQDTANKGKEYKLITAQIYETLANTEYKQVATQALEVQKNIDAYTLKLAEYKWDNELSQEYADYEAEKMYWDSMLTSTQYEILEKQLEYDTATLEDRIKTVSEQYTNLVKDTFLKAAQIELTKEQTQQITSDILVSWYQAKTYRLSQKAQVLWMKQNLQLQFSKMQIDANIAGRQMNTAIINQCIGTLGNLVGMGMLSYSNVYGKQPQQPVSNGGQQGGYYPKQPRLYFNF